MSDRIEKSVVRGLVVMALLLAAPFKGTVALAQEAIVLETIGAVRMAQPDEVRRMNAERETSRGQSQPAASQETETIRQLTR
jgi:hypothetical protein